MSQNAAVPCQSPLRLCLLGANERMRNTLAMVLEGPARGKGVLENGADADAIIVDLDNLGAEAEWARARERYPDKPAIILTIAPRDVEHATVVLGKPFTIEGLVAAIERIRHGRDPRLAAPAASVSGMPRASAAMIPPPPPDAVTAPPPVDEEERTIPVAAFADDSDAPAQAVPNEERLLHGGEPPDDNDPNGRSEAICKVDLSDPRVVADLSHDAGGHLLEWVRRARAKSLAEGCVAVFVQGRRGLVIDGTRGKAAVVLSDEALMQLCREAFGADGVQLLVVDGAAPVASGENIEVDLNALLWRLAIWTYQGRLPLGTDLQERIYLRHWPNLTRLDEVANSMRIAALLVAHPMSLDRVVEALGIGHGDVFRFYVAAREIGLVGVGKRATDSLVDASKPAQHPDRGFLRRVVKHLGGMIGGKR